jgi:hypothetical protein
MATSHLIRLAIGLDKQKMPSFIPGAKTLQGKLAAAAASYPALPVSTTVLLSQIGNVETAHLATKTTRGLVPARTVQVDILWGSFQSDAIYCAGICNTAATPAQGLALAEASGFHVVLVGDIVRPIIAVTVELGTGTVHLKANASQLHGLSGKPFAAKTYLWRHVLTATTGTTGTTTVVNDDPTSIASTTITGLPLGQTVGFQIAAKDSVGVGPWSVVIPASIH